MDASGRAEATQFPALEEKLAEEVARIEAQWDELVKERGDTWTSEVRRLLREDFDAMITTVKAQRRREFEMAAREGDEAPQGDR